MFLVLALLVLPYLSAQCSFEPVELMTEHVKHPFISNPPLLTWKLSTQGYRISAIVCKNVFEGNLFNQRQSAYQITVWDFNNKTQIFWNSGVIKSNVTLVNDIKEYFVIISVSGVTCPQFTTFIWLL